MHRAHPRSRGENSSEAGDEKGSTGSSPLTRGKLLMRTNENLVGGLIPAHAGKTSSSGRLTLGTGAHPRSRGENEEQLFDYLDTTGSSPLTRGKLVGRVDGHPDHGLIPAHAGKTTRKGCAPFPRRGSSPLTRGKRLMRR